MDSLGDDGSLLLSSLDSYPPLKKLDLVDETRSCIYNVYFCTGIIPCLDCSEKTVNMNINQPK